MSLMKKPMARDWRFTGYKLGDMTYKVHRMAIALSRT